MTEIDTDRSRKRDTVMQYDRTLFRMAAQGRGDKGFSAVARRLGVGRMTAWRLWNGDGKPNGDTIAAVELEYGVTASTLLIPLADTQATA